jgi:hypothetical protein
MASEEYHRRQAGILSELAQTTHDPQTASELMRLAAEHTSLAERRLAKDGKRGAAGRMKD